MYKLTFFVPPSHLDTVKEAVFVAGGGQLGDYSHCAWQVIGQGQFRAGDQSRPFVGKHGELETLEEYRVELVCKGSIIGRAVDALKAAHPYEEPAYDVIKLEPF